MSQIVNLRLARKQAARDAKRQAGHEAAARHAVSKAQKSLDNARAEKARAHLDQHQRDPKTDG